MENGTKEGNKAMNQNPQSNGGQNSSGGFKVNIDQRDLMASSAEAKRRRWENQNLAEQPASSPKRSSLTEKERKAEKKAHKKRNRVKARKNKRVFSIVWLCMVLLVSFTLASYLTGGSNDFFAVGRPVGTVDIVIPEGVLTEDQLADILYKAGAIKKPEFFSLYCKIKADMEDFTPGIHKNVGTDLDYEYLINTLIGGTDNREVVEVTLPEGITALQAARLLEENEVCDAQEFLTALNSRDFDKYGMIAALGETSGRYYRLEGSLFPDTYQFYKGEDLEDVIGKLLHNFEVKFDSNFQKKLDESGMTMDQVVTLASIIQAEAANATDMFDVSAVLHNRLKFGAEHDIFFLECDSTSYYPYRNAKDMEEQGGTLSYGSYDTYQVKGLPPGPICNPGQHAINAALKPNTEGDASQYLYFCHSEDGVAYYATNEYDHEENKILAGIE